MRAWIQKSGTQRHDTISARTVLRASVLSVYILAVLFSFPLPAYAASFSVSGTTYSNAGAYEGIALAGGRTVAVSVNGGAISGTTTTASDGTYTLSNITASAGDVLTLYLSGDTEKGVTVTVANGSNLTGVSIQQDDLVTRCDNSCSLTNANLITSAANGDTDISAIYADTSTLSMVSGKTLLIPTSQTFVPGTAISVYGIQIYGTLTATGGAMTVSGGVAALGSGTFTTSGVTFSGSNGSTITSRGNCFGALTINKSPTTTLVTLNDNLCVTGNLSITTGKLDVSTSNYGVTVGGNWSKTTGVTATFVGRSGTVTFNKSSGTQTLNSGGGTFYSIAHSGSGTLQFVTNAVTVTNSLTNTAGTLNLSGQNLVVTGATFSNTAILQLQGGETLTGFTNDSTHGTVTYAGTSTYTSLGAGNTYNNLTFNGSGGSWKAAAGVTVNGNLTITAGTFDLGGQSLTLANTSVFSNKGTLQLQGGETLTNFTNDPTAGGTVTYNGTSSYTGLIGGNTYGNLTFNGAGGTWTLNHVLTATGTLTLTAGTLDVSSSNYGITVSGDWASTAHGHFTARSGTVTFNKASGTQTLSGSGGSFYALTHNGSATLQLATVPLTVTSALTNAAGVLFLNSQNLTVTGAAFSNTTTLELRGDETLTGFTNDVHGTVIYLGGGPTSFTGLAAGNTYNNLTINNSGRSWTLTHDLTVSGSLTLTAGTIDASTSNYGITVGGGWTKQSLFTFTARNGTVTLNGSDQTMTGSTTFYNLTKTVTSPNTLTLAAGTTQTVTNTLTLQGAVGNLLSLRSSLAGNQWKIDPQGTRTISYLDVKDSNNVNATAIATAGNNITNSGNNTNWTFTQSSTTTLTSALNPSTFGSGVTLTATVTSGATGTVTFKDGSTSLGNVTLGHSSGSLLVSSFGVGSHVLIAVYGGDNSYLTSTSSTLTQVVNKANSSTSLVSSLNPSTFGSGVTLTATVSPSTATGTITFKDGSTTIGTATLGHGSGTLSISSLGVGSHSLAAVYAGNGNFIASTSNTLAQTVNQASSTSTLSSGSNPSTYGNSVTFTASVAPSTATGTMTVKDGPTTLGTCALSSGSCSYATSTLRAGSHSLTALYGGNGNYAGSTSSTLTQTVNKAATATSLVSSLNPSTFGSGVTLTATVSPAAATGSITFKDGSTTLATVTLGHGSGSVTTTSLSAGSHALTAAYGGNQNYLSSTSNTVSQSVAAAGTTTTLASDFNPSNAGDFVTFTALVTPNSATGTVTIKDGSLTLSTCTLTGGTCTYTTSSLSAGNHVLTAVYGGSGNDGGSTSASLTQVVGPSLSGTSGPTSGAVRGGGRRPETTAALVAAARTQILARFQDELAQGEGIAEGGSSSSAPVLARRPPVPRSRPSSASSALALMPKASSSSSSAPRELVQQSLSPSSLPARTLARAPSSPAPASPARLTPNIPAIAARRGRLSASVEHRDVLYADVQIDAWYAPYVASLIQTGVAQGYRDASGSLTGRFGVDQPVTRAEVLKMAIEAAGKRPSVLPPRNASARGTWSAGYVRTAEDLHLTVFTPDTDVNAPATRGEVVQTLLEALGFPIGNTPSSFSDVPKDHPHSAAIGLAAYYGFVSGDTGTDGTPLNRFRPDEPMNRAEVAKLIALVREVVGTPAQR
jgi:hypothetical protein